MSIFHEKAAGGAGDVAQIAQRQPRLHGGAQEVGGAGVALKAHDVCVPVDLVRVRGQLAQPGAQGGLDSIDFNGLSSVDIVRGANSSVVGSGALGGAVALYTLNPEDLLQGGKDFGSIFTTL